jgi:cell division protein FtsX
MPDTPRDATEPTDPTDPTTAANGPAEPTERPQRPRWLVLLSATVAAFLAGAAAATAVIVIAGRYEHPHLFSVVVYLDTSATAEQKASLQSALAALDSDRAVQFESREQALKNAQDLLKDRPDLLSGLGAASLPESYKLTFTEIVFDCDRLTAARHMAGVDQIKVIQRPESGRPAADIACGNLL